MRLAITNGVVVTPETRLNVDVLCEDGVVVGHEPWGSAWVADKVFDAEGMLVLPGLIDPHVHSREPGFTHKEDFEHATKGALAGGITTVFEMPNAVPAVTSPSIFSDRRKLFSGRSYTDFGLWSMATGQETETELAELRSAGSVAAKVFWGYALDRTKGSLIYGPSDANNPDHIQPASNGDMWRLFGRAAKAGLFIALHCEDVSIGRAALEELGGSVDKLEDLRAARPAIAESVAIATVIELARSTGARVHIVHVSTGRSVRLIRRAQDDGIAISAETCPHYLSAEVNSRVGIGIHKVFPPTRGKDDALALWDAVADRTIQSIGSDHAPHSVEDLQRSPHGRPAGVAGTETMSRVLLQHSREGRMNIEDMVWSLSEGTARLYGLYPKKGALAPGSDADLTIIDVDVPWTIKGSNLQAKSKSTPWDGMSGSGAAVAAILGGALAMVDGRPLGPPRGQFVRPIDLCTRS